MLVNGQLPVPGMELGERIFYCTPTAKGTGTGLNWDNACTMRTAISRANGLQMTTIFLGAGKHDADNGVDGTGTEISAAYVRIIGFGEGDEPGNASQISNSNAAATHCLRVTGGHLAISHIIFDNQDETSVGVVHLTISGDHARIKSCVFTQAVADAGVTNIYFDNGSTCHSIAKCRFQFSSNYGIDINDSNNICMDGCEFVSCDIGLYASHASADTIVAKHNVYVRCATAIDIDTAITGNWTFLGENFAGCTVNIADASDYGGDIFFGSGVVESNRGAAVYPTGAGVSVNTGDGTWTWTTPDPTTIIPADTIAKPFKIKSIHPQDWTAAQIYKIEILYGEVTANISAGIYEFSLGDPAAKGKAAATLDLDFYIPPMAIVGVKIMSSTNGVDNLVMTFGYEPL